MPRRAARAWGSVDRGKHRRAIELRKHLIPEAELVAWREGNMGRSDKRGASCSGGVEEPGMCGHSPRGNRETSGRNLHGTEASMTEAIGEVSSRKPVVVSPEESDGNIVPVKSVNNEVVVSAESMEGRMPTKRNLQQEAANRIQSRNIASIGLNRVRQRVESDNTFRFNVRFDVKYSR